MVQRQQRTGPHAAESPERQRDEPLLHRQLRIAENDESRALQSDGWQFVLYQPHDPKKSAAPSVSPDVGWEWFQLRLSAAREKSRLVDRDHPRPTVCQRFLRKRRLYRHQIRGIDDR